MRKLVAFVVLLCSAASADAADMCSSNAVLKITGQDESLRYVLKTGGETKTFRYGGSVGTGVRAFQLVANGKVEVVKINDQSWLFRGQIFRPCP